MRESRSRPTWSVPSGYSRDGGSFSREKFVLVYGRGARTSARSAMRQRAMTTMPPTTARRLRRSRRKAPRQRLDEAGCATAARAGIRTASAGTLLVPDAGVESAIDQVDDQVHSREKRAVHEDNRHDHRIVPAGHREDEE